MRGRTLLLAALLLIAGRQALATTAADIPCATSSPPPGPCVVNSDVHVTNLSVLDFQSRGLVVSNGKSIDAGGGTMTIKASSVVLQPRAILSSQEGVVTVMTTGAVDIQANADGSGRSRIDVIGNSGGAITVDAGGPVTITGQLLADARAVLGSGGSIDVTGSSVSVATSGKISAEGGPADIGGDITITAVDTDVMVSGTVDASAEGDGGTIDIEADDNIISTPTAVFSIKSGEAGSGDEIDFTTFDGQISLAGKIIASAGGSLENGGGSGADLVIEAGSTLTLDAPIDLTGAGPGAFGGYPDLDAEGNVTLRAPIDLSAPGTDGSAGFIFVSSTLGKIDIQQDITAVGSSAGGDIDVATWGDLSVSSDLTTDGFNGTVELAGCALDVTGNGKVSSIGNLGANLLRSSGKMTITGTVQAGASNRLEWLTQVPTISGLVTPAPVTVQNPTLVPCGGPPSTTTTTHPSTTTTTSTTVTTSTTTTTTLVGPVTTTTTTTLPAPVTTTTTVPAATTTTTTQIGTTSTTTINTTTTSSTLAASTTTTTAVSTTTTSTAASTTTVPTTTSTTSPPPSSTTTVAPPTTTTSTLPGAVCEPADCNDQDLCTDDVCDPVMGCVHTPRTSFAGVTCRLDTLSNTIAATPATEVGGLRLQRRLQVKVDKANRLVDLAEKAQGSAQDKKLKRAGKLLGSFVRAVVRGEGKGKIEPAVGARLRELAGGAANQLLPLVNQ